MRRDARIGLLSGFCSGAKHASVGSVLTLYARGTRDLRGLLPVGFIGDGRATRPSRCALPMTAFLLLPIRRPISAAGTPSAHKSRSIWESHPALASAAHFLEQNLPWPTLIRLGPHMKCVPHSSHVLCIGICYLSDMRCGVSSVSADDGLLGADLPCAVSASRIYGASVSDGVPPGCRG
jgi:hypothetical protein